MFAYRPPNFDKSMFFKEVTACLNKAVNVYENIMVAADLNTDLLRPKYDTGNFMSDLNDILSLSNIIKEPTCFKSENHSLLDILLTNKVHCFQKTATFVTGISDCHKLIITVLRAGFKRLPAKRISYRSYKNFEKRKFLRDLDKKLIEEVCRKCEDL